jgi:hypothetical protein
MLPRANRPVQLGGTASSDIGFRLVRPLGPSSSAASHFLPDGLRSYDGDAPVDTRRRSAPHGRSVARAAHELGVPIRVYRELEAGERVPMHWPDPDCCPNYADSCEAHADGQAYSRHGSAPVVTGYPAASHPGSPSRRTLKPSKLKPWRRRMTDIELASADGQAQ